MGRQGTCTPCDIVGDELLHSRRDGINTLYQHTMKKSSRTAQHIAATESHSMLVREPAFCTCSCGVQHCTRVETPAVCRLAQACSDMAIGILHEEEE